MYAVNNLLFATKIRHQVCPEQECLAMLCIALLLTW